MPPRRTGSRPLTPDVRRLWAAHAVSAVGSGLAYGALPFVAVTVLDASDAQVSVLAAVSMLAAAALALPLGAWVEQRRKRPVMVAADLARAAATLSVPLAAWAGRLTFAHLCAAGIVGAVGQVAFTAASGAHLKALVPAPERAEANGRFEQATWFSLGVAPPVGGALVAVAGPLVTLALDAVSFVLSALQVRSLRTPEPVSAHVSPHGLRGDVADGVRHLWRHRTLRPLLLNSLVFGGAVMLVSPVQTVLMLRELGFTPLMYGLALGLPCLGGLLGARAMPRLVDRFGLPRVLWWSGVLRVPWLVPVAFVPHGVAGLAVILIVDTALLVVAGVFNPVVATHRLDVTPSTHVSRVVTAWSTTSRLAQAGAVLAGAALTTLVGVRGTILLAGCVCVTSALVLPRLRDLVHAEPGDADPDDACTGAATTGAGRRGRTG